MYKLVLDVFVFVGILLSGKPNQPIIIQIDHQRVNAIYQHVKSDIEFVAINKHRVLHIFLYQVLLVLFILFYIVPYISDQLYSIPTSPYARFTNILLLVFFSIFYIQYLLFKFGQLVWQHETLREKVEMFFELLFHIVQVIKQKVFEGQTFTVYEVIDFLMKLKLTIFVEIYNTVEPDQVIILYLNILHPLCLDRELIKIAVQNLSEKRTILIHLFQKVLLIFFCLFSISFIIIIEFDKLVIQKWDVLENVRFHSLLLWQF